MPRTTWTGTRCCCTTSLMTRRQQACRRSGVRCAHFQLGSFASAAGRSRLATAPLLCQCSGCATLHSARLSNTRNGEDSKI
jgi:hypothetical protein